MSWKPEHFHDNVMDAPSSSSSSSSSSPAAATSLPLPTSPKQNQQDHARPHHHQQQQHQHHHHQQQQQQQTRPPSSRIQREDILCCHDLPYAAHVGNRMYVIRLSLYLENHPTASTTTATTSNVMTVEERFKASMDMVKIIRTKQRGRFLAKTKKGTWKDIGDALAVKWISLHIKRFFALQQGEQRRTIIAPTTTNNNHNQEGTIKTETTTDEQTTSTTTPGTTAITASVVVQRQPRPESDHPMQQQQQQDEASTAQTLLSIGSGSEGWNPSLGGGGGGTEDAALLRARAVQKLGLVHHKTLATTITSPTTAPTLCWPNPCRVVVGNNNNNNRMVDDDDDVYQRAITLETRAAATEQELDSRFHALLQQQQQQQQRQTSRGRKQGGNAAMGVDNTQRQQKELQRLTWKSNLARLHKDWLVLPTAAFLQIVGQNNNNNNNKVLAMVCVGQELNGRKLGADEARILFPKFLKKHAGDEIRRRCFQRGLALPVEALRKVQTQLEWLADHPCTDDIPNLHTHLNDLFRECDSKRNPSWMTLNTNNAKGMRLS